MATRAGVSRGSSVGAVANDSARRSPSRLPTRSYSRSNFDVGAAGSGADRFHPHAWHHVT